MNLIRAATFPVSFCTSLGLRDGSMSRMAWIFRGFALMPLWLTMNPRNFPEATPKAHLFGLSFIPNYLRMAKQAERWAAWYLALRLFTNMSST